MTLPEMETIWPRLVEAAPPALAVIVAAFIVNAVVNRGLTVLARRARVTETETQPVRRALRWVIVVAAAILVLGAFGVNVGGVWGVLSTLFAMVAIGFVAVWSVLSNSLCTLMIIVFRPFSVGDEVEFPGEPMKGRVVDLNFMYTTIDAGDGSVFEVPNNLFFQKTLRRRRAATAVSPVRHLRNRTAGADDRDAPLGQAAARPS